MPSLQSPVEAAGADAGASIVVALASAFFDFVSATGVAFVAVDVVPDAFLEAVQDTGFAEELE